MVTALQLRAVDKMKYKNITYKNKNLTRISEKKVYNIINNPSQHEGLTIYMLPINANPESPWINGFFELTIENIIYMDSIDYSNYISECKYYNCGSELGSYLKYYIEK